MDFWDQGVDPKSVTMEISYDWYYKQYTNMVTIYDQYTFGFWSKFGQRMQG